MSSKFLDKTGLDTLWAKIKSTFQTLGNLATSWGSTPSDTKYPSEKLVKDSLDAISTNARTIPQDISKGANLVVNGSGRMSSNYNFSGFTYLPTICYNGSAGSFGFNGTNSNSEFISCDFNKKIVFSADIRNLVAQPSNCVHRIYVAEYDIDKKSVVAMYVMYGVGTLTELTQDLNPGDTVVHLADLSNANWLSSTTYHRGFIFWNYQNSYGYLYPPETYSRNVYPSGESNPLWDVANVNVSAGTITLNSGWTGPAIPAGTKVSRRSSGNSYPYPAQITTGDTEWHSLKGYVKGIVAPGTSERVSTKFSQGTAFIKVGMYTSNLTNTDPVTGKRAAVTNFFVYEEQDINDGFGTLPVNRGGTGATTAIGAEYNILNQVADINTTINGDRKIALCNQTKSASNGVFRWLKLSNVWTWIKGLLSSESGVNISGNAATATAAAGYTSGGAIDTALQGKATPADITSAIQALDVDSQGGNGKYIKAISEADGKISATAETMDTAPTANSTKAVTSGGVKTALDDKVDKETGMGLSSNDFTTDEKDKLAGISNGAEVNVQSDWNQTTTTADDYIKNKPQNLVQDASYVHTDNNYTTEDKNKVASAVQPGDLGSAAYKDVPASGNASSSQVVMGNDSRLAENIRAMNVDSSQYLCIRIKKGQNHRNASVTLFCGNDEYPAIVNIGFVYLTSPREGEAAGFKNSPLYHMVEVNNATSANYVPNVSYKYDSSTGDGYIYCKWSSLKRLTVLINTYAPADIILSTLTSLPTGTTDAQKGHTIPHIDGINVAVGSPTKPAYVSESGQVRPCNNYGGGTAVTLNGSSKAAGTASFYAPTAAGTAGKVLKSNGSSAPTWGDAVKYVTSIDTSTMESDVLYVM